MTAALTRASVPVREGEPTTLVLARHGRTADTERGVFAGRDGDDPPLSAAGEGDAARFAAGLARLGTAASPVPGLAPVTAIVASPMARTQGTAKAVAEQLGLQVATDEDWAEMAFGAWSGLTYAEIAATDPAALQTWWGDAGVAPPGGESFDALAERIGVARRRTVEAHQGRVVAVVTHGGPVRIVVREALEGGPATLWRLRVTPCALTVVRYWPDGGIEVVTVNAAAVAD